MSITGVAMLTCFAVGAPFAVGWPRRKRWFMRLCPRAAAALNDFSNFWITHHVLGLFYVFLVLHP